MDKETITDLSPGIIENMTFNFPVLIEGSQFDSTIIRNCTFTDIDGNGLELRDVKNLIIENCTFTNITDNAIRFRNQSSSEGVVVRNNIINNIGKSGISSAQNHIDVVITNNTINQVATEEPSNVLAASNHGINFQGGNFTITNNVIYDVINEKGNGIHVGSSGLVSSNRIYNVAQHGISYRSESDGLESELLVENNIIYYNGERCVQLESNGNAYNHVTNAVVRFNTLVSADRSLIGTDDTIDGVPMNFYGNIMVREDAVNIYFFSNASYTQSQNLLSSTDVGFVDAANRDFHITSASTAVNFGTGAPGFPLTDFDGEPRASTNLDAGADEL